MSSKSKSFEWHFTSNYMSTSFSASESSNEDMTSTRSLSVTLLCTEKRCYSIPPHHYFIQIHSVPFTETMLSFVSRKKRVNLSLHRVFESYRCFQYEPSGLYYTFRWYQAKAIPCDTKNTLNIYSNLQPITTETNTASKRSKTICGVHAKVKIHYLHTEVGDPATFYRSNTRLTLDAPCTENFSPLFAPR